MGRINRRWLGLVLATVLCVSVLGSPSALAAGDYVVDEDHDAGWHRQSTTEAHPCGFSTPSGSQTFEAGPAGIPQGASPSPGPPSGVGSLEFRTGAEGQTIERFRNTRYAGRTIASLDTLTYWTYVDPASAPASVRPPIPDPNNPQVDPDPNHLFPFQVAVSIVLLISETGDGTHLNTLTFEPVYQGEVKRGEWQMWDATSASANWYLGHDQNTANMKPLDDWTFGGKATIVNETPSLGGVMLVAGCGDPDPWANFIGNTDLFKIGFGQDLTTYDMEPFVPGNSARHLDCSPEGDDNPTGTSHTILCTATDQFGEPAEGTKIAAEITGANDPDGDTPATRDLSCVTDEDGRCPLTHGPSTHGTTHAGTSTYRAWIDEDDREKTVEGDLEEEQPEDSRPGSTPEGEDGDNTDVVTKVWSASRLDCELETVTLPVGSSHTVTCIARDAAGAVVPETPVDVEATGVNDPDGSSSNSLATPDFSCTTDVNGGCTFTHGPAASEARQRTTTTPGRTTYRAWIDADDRNTTTSEADLTEGRDHGTSRGSEVEPDRTDVVEANWSTTEASPTPGPTCFTPSPTPPGASPSPTPSGTPCPARTQTPTPTPTPTPTASGTPRPTSSPTGPADDRLTSGPCKGYLPDSRTARSGSGEVIVGTPGPDRLTGSDGDDLICGLGGADLLRGKRGYDTVFGARAGDTIYGSNGRDSIMGGKGADDLHGGRGQDRVYGGAGRDSCVGGSGRNRLRACE